MIIQRTRQRSITLFEESIKSKYTKKNYISNLNQFKGFAGIKTVDTLLTISQSDLQDLLEDYLMALKQNTNPNSIPSKFRGIKHFCVMNRINLNWEIIHKMFPQKQKSQYLRSYTTKEIRQILSDTKNLRDIALIHFLASTGARIGVFDHKLSMSHIKKMPHGCYAVKLYAGYVEEYWSFLTPQASKALNVYQKYRKQCSEIFCEDTPIFAAMSADCKQLGWSGARSVVSRAVSRSITRHKENSRYDVQTDHGFRKRFNTILKMSNSVNYNIAEKLMGHRNGLDGVYLTPTLEELFAEFKKIIKKLETGPKALRR